MGAATYSVRGLNGSVNRPGAYPGYMHGEKPTAPSDLKGETMEEEHYLMKYFKYSHLPPHLAKISQPFYELALQIWDNRSGKAEHEVSAGLRKLLEAKDCIVRSHL